LVCQAIFIVVAEQYEQISPEPVFCNYHVLVGQIIAIGTSSTSAQGGLWRCRLYSDDTSPFSFWIEEILSAVPQTPFYAGLQLPGSPKPEGVNFHFHCIYNVDLPEFESYIHSGLRA
jgi:hypothetical protein